MAMNLTELRKKLTGQRVALLGLGIENLALAHYLIRESVATDYTVLDARSPRQLGGRYDELNALADQHGISLSWRTGPDYDKDLAQYNCIFRIAGYPLFTQPIIEAMMAGSCVSSATKLFFDLCPTRNIIGVTGSKGKGTTATLIYQILKDAGRRVCFGGNIGTPLFSFIKKIKPDDWVVLELSSFQLEDLHTSPPIAVFTNFYPDHLAAADPANPNYHKTLHSYWQAKTAIFAYQKKHDILIASDQLEDQLITTQPRGKLRFFTKSELPSGLIGEHNKKNIAAAVLAAKAAGVAMADIKRTVKRFKGLEHRLEFVGTYRDVRYYNDSFATAPHPANTALQSFHPQSVILIAGGASKAANYRTFATHVKTYAKRIILLPGKGSEEIAAALQKVRYGAIEHAPTMKQAVRSAAKHAEAGDVVLLSPACASFGLFANYKERGEQFKEAVGKL